MVLSQRVFPLKGVVQHYSWGGYNFLPSLLGQENKEQKPFAEYWLGSHPNHPSVILSGENNSLQQVINNDPFSYLGAGLALKYSSLPFLFKVLDVRQMLSIQVHPSKEAAELGYEEENNKGIPVKAPNRNYKDKNHKPEMMVALSDFWLLHGFKNALNLEMILEATPELSFLKAIFEERSYHGLYQEVMTMEQKEVNKVLAPLVQRILPLYEQGELSKDNEDFWAARAVKSFSKDDNYDRGIFSIYFFNLLHLKKGEGIYQPGGMPHAYLEGQNVEVMANSDNVLRAGLTDKHIDVPELMKHVSFEPTDPVILTPSKGAHHVFETGAEEFELHQYELKDGAEEKIEVVHPDIFLVTEGEITVNSAGEEYPFQKGGAFFVKPGTELSLISKEDSTLFRVTVPS